AGSLGFAVFGGGYFALAFLGLSHHNLEKLPTSWLLLYVHQRVAPAQAYSLVLTTNAGGQPQGTVLLSNVTAGPTPNTITTTTTTQYVAASGVSANASGRWMAMLPGAANYEAFSAVGHCLFALLAGLLGVVIARWARIRG